MILFEKCREKLILSSDHKFLKALTIFLVKFILIVLIFNQK